jgi:hypothetical protein
MKATNPLAGAFLALVAIVILTLTISYGNSRESGSRDRQPLLTATDAGSTFAQRGQRTRIVAATRTVTANSGRTRYGEELTAVASVH